MARVSLEAILTHALKNNYGVGAYNVTSFAAMRGILQAAEEQDSPVILSFAELHFPHMDFEILMHGCVRLAERASIPVVLHLDHGQSMAAVMQAIRYGASSVMIDASVKPLAENIARTKEVVDLCAPLGISVEGELGCIGGGEGDGTEHEVDTSLFTDPNQAIEYTQQTGINALAIAFGNVHGKYKNEPKLNFALLEEIQHKVQLPLVLHGGSGIADSDFQKAISLGICKINFYTQNSLESQAEIMRYMQEFPPSSGKDMVRLWDIVAEVHRKNAAHNMHCWGSAKRGLQAMTEIA